MPQIKLAGEKQKKVIKKYRLKKKSMKRDMEETPSDKQKTKCRAKQA